MEYGSDGALEQPLGEHQDFLDAVHVVHQDGELVAAEAGNRIHLAETFLQPPADLLQDLSLPVGVRGCH